MSLTRAQADTLKALLVDRCEYLDSSAEFDELTEAIESSVELVDSRAARCGPNVGPPPAVARTLSSDFEVATQPIPAETMAELQVNGRRTRDIPKAGA